MKPITRIDMYLAVISGDEDAVTPLPEPITRIDMYLASLAGMDVVELPEPITRIDYYLAALCGMNVVIPDEPVTRIDFYLAALNGQTVDTPEAITRIDHYLDAWAGGSSLPWETFTGNPLQFDAPKAHVLKSVKVEFSPTQSGSGDPSPDNVRPISGRTALDVVRAGENLWDEQWEQGAYSTSGKPLSASQLRSKATDPIRVTGGVSYCFVCTSARVSQIYWYDANDEFISNTSNSSSSAFVTTAPLNACYCRFQCPSAYGTTYKNDISINYPSTDTEYHPTKGISTTTLSFGQTVYGGTAEVAEDGTATGSDEWANIASYNGETITEPWLSSMDKYVSGATPTTGAQVVYKKATPTPFTVTASDTPTAVQGINTMWTDGDNLTVEAKGEAVNLSALQSLNMLLGGRYYNNGTADEPTDEEALDILLGGNER